MVFGNSGQLLFNTMFVFYVAYKYFIYWINSVPISLFKFNIFPTPGCSHKMDTDFEIDIREHIFRHTVGYTSLAHLSIAAK